MSTPSTAVATHPHQYYSHHQSYNPTGLGAYSLNAGLTNGYGRLANSQSNAYSASRQDSTDLRAYQSSTRPSADSAAYNTQAGMSASGHDSYMAKRKPDWGEFYKNGLPKEVIVIDDDSPEPASASSRAGNASKPASVNGVTKHTDKKRRTGPNTPYDPVYQQHTSYSTTQTPYAEHSSGHNTVSTDRTTSAINTTAPTSLGSQISNAAAYKAPMEEGTAGLKRKRSTRQAAQEDVAPQAKKRHVEQPGDPYDHYVPPPNPPIKAKDVYVQVVHDVRTPAYIDLTKTTYKHQHKKNHQHSEKCDDEDGHYIVAPEADLTERCMCSWL